MQLLWATAPVLVTHVNFILYLPSKLFLFIASKLVFIFVPGIAERSKQAG